MTKTNYAEAMVNLSIGMSQTIDELIDYCYEQFGIKDIMRLDSETLVLLQKTMALTKAAQDYTVISAQLMKQFDQQLTSINQKMDQLLQK